MIQLVWVAPFVGAWIETSLKDAVGKFYESLPSWERGLKLNFLVFYGNDMMSLPSWERGLKPVSPASNGQGSGRSLRGSVD